MSKLLARAKVLAASAVTWLVTAAAVVAIVADEAAKVFPDNAATIASVAVRAGAVIAAAVTIIRRVTPVLPEARGILDNGKPNSDLEAIGTTAIRHTTLRKAEREHVRLNAKASGGAGGTAAYDIVAGSTGGGGGTTPHITGGAGGEQYPGEFP